MAYTINSYVNDYESAACDCGRPIYCDDTAYEVADFESYPDDPTVSAPFCSRKCAAIEISRLRGRDEAEEARRLKAIIAEGVPLAREWRTLPSSTRLGTPEDDKLVALTEAWRDLIARYGISDDEVDAIVLLASAAPEMAA